MSIGTEVIPTCDTCGHTARTCPKCGGRDGYNQDGIVLPICIWCRRTKPSVGTDPPMLEPSSIVGWVSGPDGIYEVATSSGQAIPRDATPERRPINQALYCCCEILADAIQTGQWRDKEEALECWQLLRGDVERHLSEDERNRGELLRWVAEMSKGEPRIEFAPEFIARLVDLVEKLFCEGVNDEEGFHAWMLKTGPQKSAWVQSLADRCARAARVTGWREREQS